MAGPERHAPAEYPPPVDVQKEFIKRELDAEDERIEVGVAIVPKGRTATNLGDPSNVRPGPRGS